MPNFFDFCQEQTCGHTTCLLMRKFQQHEEEHKLPISESHKLEAVTDVIIKLIDERLRLRIPKQESMRVKSGRGKANGTPKEPIKGNSPAPSPKHAQPKRRLVDLEQEIVAAAEEWEKEKAAPLSQLRGLKTDQEQFKAKISKLESQNEKLRKKEVSLQKSVENAQQQLQECDAVNNVLKDQKVVLEDENKTLQEGLKALKLQIEDLTTKHRDSEETKMQLVGDNAALKSKMALLGEELEAAEGNLATVREALQEHKDKFHTFRKAQESSQAHNAWLQDQTDATFLMMQACIQRTIDARKVTAQGHEQFLQDNPLLLPQDTTKRESVTSCTSEPITPVSQSLDDPALNNVKLPRPSPPLPPELARIEPSLANRSFSRRPPTGPKRPRPPNPEPRARKRSRRGADSWRPGD